MSVKLNIKPAMDRKKVVWIENGTKKEIGYTSEEIHIDESKNLLNRKQELVYFSGEERRIDLVLDRDTFQPIYLLDKGSEEIEISYNSKDIRILTKDEESHYILKEEVYDLFSVELLLRVWPLESGFSKQIRVFSSMVKDVIDVSIDVDGLEKVFDGNQDVFAWKINVEFGGSLQIYWISKESRELLKQSIRIREGVFLDFIR